MAGVPTGRGCDACRRQKKKCDLAKPACSRCTRLRIACIGCGERRYKFKQEIPATRDPVHVQGHSGHLLAAVAGSSGPVPGRPPGNELMRGAGAFVAVLEISDLRYDISSFGMFLKELPQRMGRNKALDASVQALTTVFPILYTRQLSSEMLASYIHALKCLRMNLTDRGWIGKPDDKPVSHSEAVVHILNCIAINDWQGRFENQLFMTLGVFILPESIYNPKISPGPWFRRIVDNFTPHMTTSQRSGGPGPALTFLTLARLVKFVRDPRGDLSDIQMGYDAILGETAQARENLERIARQPTSQPNDQCGGRDWEKVQLRCQAQHAALLAVTMLVNSLLSALMPGNTELAEHVAGFADELVDMSKEASKYRPIGSGFIPVCMFMGFVATTDLSQLAKMTDAMAAYGHGPIQSTWESWAIKMRDIFQDLRFKVALAHLENSLS